jgi:hypothetical protein
MSPTTFLTASPSRGGQAINTWISKRNKPRTVKLYMLCWSLEALLVLRENVPEYKDNVQVSQSSKCYSPQLVQEQDDRELFTLYGGDVRSCVVQLVPRESPDPTRDFAANSLLELQKKSVGRQYLQSGPPTNPEISRRQRSSQRQIRSMSHSLLKLVPSVDFQSLSFAFCSNYMRDEVLKNQAYQTLVRAIACCVCVRLAALLPHSTPADKLRVRSRFLLPDVVQQIE